MRYSCQYGYEEDATVQSHTPVYSDVDFEG
jgi:hypothetical protein